MTNPISKTLDCIESVRVVRHFTQFVIDTPYGIAEVIHEGPLNYTITAVHRYRSYGVYKKPGDDRLKHDEPEVWSTPSTDSQRATNELILQFIRTNAAAIWTEIKRKGGAS